MSFFRQLSQLVKSLEKDVEEFRMLDHQPQKSEADHEAAGQKALLTANCLQSDVTQLQKCMEQTTKSLQADGGFLDLVAITEALVAKQKENINQMEEYLQQYGYQPLADGQPKTAAEKDGRDQTGLLTTETASRSTEVNGKFNTLESQERPNPCKENVTPEKTSEIDYDEIMRTPKLEDFGLSEERLNQYKTYGAALKPSQDSNGKASAGPTIVASCPGEMIQMNGCDVTGTMAIPPDFQHAGLCPTPGFTGGRDSTHRQDDSFPLETPQMLRPKSREAYNTCSNQDEEDTDFTQMLCLPDPPVLLTPGVKQIKKLNIRDQPAPVLHMGDCNEESLQNASLDDNGLGSPVPPVLCTPGVKQLKKPSEVVSEETRKPILSYTDDCMDTPEMPELTMGWIGLKNLTAQTARNLEPVRDSSSVPINTTTSDSRCISSTTGSRINPSEMFRNIGKTTQQSISEEDSLPEMPELTSTQGLNLNWRTGLGQGMCTGKTSEAQSSPDCTPLLKSHDVDLSPLPPMPELTGTYNFSVKSRVVASQTTEARHTGQSYMKSRSKQEEEERIEDKENLAPRCTQWERNSTSSNHKATRFAQISEDEYGRQPDYVQRIVSLDLLNRALIDLEQIFLDQEEGGQNVCVTERDLQPLLESRTKPVILSLTKLGRLRLMRQGQEPAYVPAT